MSEFIINIGNNSKSTPGSSDYKVFVSREELKEILKDYRLKPGYVFDDVFPEFKTEEKIFIDKRFLGTKLSYFETDTLGGIDDIYPELNTENKTIIGAINEVHDELDLTVPRVEELEFNVYKIMEDGMLLPDIIKADQIFAGSVTTEKIFAGAITTEKIRADSIIAEQIKVNQISADHLQANSVTALKIAAEQINAGHITAEAIEAKHISSEAIETKHLSANVVTSDKILANQILSKHIEAEQIRASHIAADQIDAVHINSDQIETRHLKADQIEAKHIKSDQIETRHLTADSIKAGNIAADQIESKHITTGAILADGIAANQIETKHITAGAIKADQIDAKAINTTHLNANIITGEHIQVGAITADKAIIADGAIGNAQISNVSANKIDVGTIDTSKVKIKSQDAVMELYGNQILVNDTTDALNPQNRVILGEYPLGEGTEYGLLVRGKDGQTVMIDGTGVHNAGITDGAIDNNKVADDANISGLKLDIDSVIRTVNENGTETIAGTKVQVGDRTLDIELSTQKQMITDNTTELSTQKSQISALDDSIKLKVDSQEYTNFKTSVGENFSVVQESISKNTADIEINKEQIALKVSQTEVNDIVTGEVNKTVKSVISEYAKNQSATTAPTTGWTITPPEWQNGWYIWSRTKTTMMSGSVSTSDPVNITGAKGDSGQDGAPGAPGTPGSDGKGIKSTTITYQASSSGTTVPTGSWSSTVPSVSANQFLWTKTTLTYTDNTTTDAYSVGKMGANGATGSQGPQGPAGSNGADGKGIKSTDITYQASSSGTTVPTGTWSTSIPSVSSGQFLWTRTIITYTDNTTATAYSVGKMGEQGPQGNQGNPGATGQGVQSITSLYKMLDTKEQQPTPTSDSGWSTTPPTWQNGKYIHTCSKIVYKNPTATAYTVPICDSSWEAANGVQDDLNNKYTQINDKFGQIDTQLGQIDISVGEITTANFAKDVDNKINSYVVGTGSNVSSDVKGKVKKSICVLTICGEAVGGVSSTVVLNGIKTVSKTGEILTDLDLGEVKLYLSSSGKYDEYTDKGIIRRVDSETGGDAQMEGIENAPALLVQVEEGCTIQILANRNVHSKHTVALSTLASIESSVSSINLTKHDIEMKVDRDGVIAAINIGVEDDETSKILISADKINLEGKVTISALEENLKQIYEIGTDKTVINGGYIKSGSIDLTGELWANGITVYEKVLGSNGQPIIGPDGDYVKGDTTFSVTGRGEVAIKGNVESMNFSDTEGWRILADGTAIFNQGEFRSKIVLPRAGMTNEGNVRIWAGGNTPATALFRVLDSGDVYVEKGYFKGVFSGDIKIGGISITDEGLNTGRALISIKDNAEKTVTEIADNILSVGTNMYVKNMLTVDTSVKVTGSDFNFNDKIIFKESDSSISFNNDFANFRVNGTKFDFMVTEENKSTDFEFSNSARDTIVEIQGELKVKSNVDIGVVTIRKTDDGIDFLFI